MCNKLLATGHWLRRGPRYANPGGTRRVVVKGQRPEAGFTLVEIIVALSVIAVGVLGAVAVSTVYVKASESNERRVAAVNLAREGIEAVRNIRDTNWQTYLAQRAGGASGPQRALADWDCYPATQSDALAVPFSCDGHLAVDFRDADTNFILYPLAADPASGAALNGVAYLVRDAGAVTDSSQYILCRQGVRNLYLPKPGADPANPDASTPTGCAGKPYYRRLTIRSVKSASGSCNIKVQAWVTWPERAAKYRGQADNGDIYVEEYLTDWRRLDATNPAGSC